MRVCHFYAGNRFGGLERTLVHLQQFRALTPGVKHRFVLNFEGRLSRELRAHGADVQHVPLAGLRRPLQVTRALWQLFRLLRRERVEALVCHEIWNYVLGYLPARAAGLRPLLWCHTANFSYRLYRLLAFLPPAGIIACSEHVRARLLERWPRYPVEVVRLPHPGLAPRTRPSAKRDVPVILFVGRLTPYKGLRVLLQALELLKTLPWRCTVVGGAQDVAEQAFQRELEQAAAAAGLSGRIQFAGEQEDVAPWYQGADVFCHPNTEPEAFGLVFIEALSAGLPVVATQLGGAEEIFAAASNAPGKLVPPGDASALASALRDVLGKPHAREIARREGPALALRLCAPSETMPRCEAALRTLSA